MIVRTCDHFALTTFETMKRKQMYVHLVSAFVDVISIEYFNFSVPPDERVIKREER